MKLRRDGFFRELEHGDSDGPSLLEAVRSEPHPDEQKILNYLRSGVVFVVIPMIVKNILHTECPDQVPAYIATDGVWAWPNDLQLYVSMDHVRVAEEFLSHMASQQWRVPSEESMSLREFEL